MYLCTFGEESSESNVNQRQKKGGDVWDGMLFVEDGVDWYGVEEDDGENENHIKDAQGDQQVSKAGLQVQIPQLQNEDGEYVPKEPDAPDDWNKGPFKDEDEEALHADHGLGIDLLLSSCTVEHMAGKRAQVIHSNHRRVVQDCLRQNVLFQLLTTFLHYR